jgi:hypothetical protein
VHTHIVGERESYAPDRQSVGGAAKTRLLTDIAWWADLGGYARLALRVLSHRPRPVYRTWERTTGGCALGNPLLSTSMWHVHVSRACVCVQRACKHEQRQHMRPFCTCQIAQVILSLARLFEWMASFTARRPPRAAWSVEECASCCSSSLWTSHKEALTTAHRLALGLSLSRIDD